MCDDDTYELLGRARELLSTMELGPDHHEAGKLVAEIDRRFPDLAPSRSGYAGHYAMGQRVTVEVNGREIDVHAFTAWGSRDRRDYCDCEFMFGGVEAERDAKALAASDNAVVVWHRDGVVMVLGGGHKVAASMPHDDGGKTFWTVKIVEARVSWR